MKCRRCEELASFLVPYGKYNEHEIIVAMCERHFKDWSGDKQIEGYYTEKIDTQKPQARII